jgi:hypothetical protein
VHQPVACQWQKAGHDARVAQRQSDAEIAQGVDAENHPKQQEAFDSRANRTRLGVKPMGDPSTAGPEQSSEFTAKLAQFTMFQNQSAANEGAPTKTTFQLEKEAFQEAQSDPNTRWHQMGPHSLVEAPIEKGAATEAAKSSAQEQRDTPSDATASHMTASDATASHTTTSDARTSDAAASHTTASSSTDAVVQPPRPEDASNEVLKKYRERRPTEPVEVAKAPMGTTRWVQQSLNAGLKKELGETLHSAIRPYQPSLACKITAP